MKKDILGAFFCLVNLIFSIWRLTNLISRGNFFDNLFSYVIFITLLLLSIIFLILFIKTIAPFKD
ncbi:hypothetical protein GCM10007380_08740 [Gottfriedia solisilvae]|uniref:Uncharacterized protein n=1 Tax=Gottfriedia solisilvae TaxID=1516104 RepID=A0A8J3AFJ8_9BACI|nr:hypothetical protein GCM10007380_08740 [Gottfriedia solisilvae]